MCNILKFETFKCKECYTFWGIISAQKIKYIMVYSSIGRQYSALSQNKIMFLGYFSSVLSLVCQE